MELDSGRRIKSKRKHSNKEILTFEMCLYVCKYKRSHLLNGCHRGFFSLRNASVLSNVRDNIYMSVYAQVEIKWYTSGSGLC